MKRLATIAALVGTLALVGSSAAVFADDTGHGLEPGLQKRDNIAQKAANNKFGEARDLSVEWAGQLHHQIEEHEIPADYDAAGCESEWDQGMEARLMEAGIGAVVFGDADANGEKNVGTLKRFLYDVAQTNTDATTAAGRQCLEAASPAPSPAP